ncbi:hypothetical protein [Amycolatopsis sp. GM8]|uniref:hypothetical protein n=1 Tax=Amycolatopsis sp. GM8 TaxID=2896530 RepID=UPI001F26E625|nr:hypothetical protein [Amycolatopsis sp. GM8]
MSRTLLGMYLNEHLAGATTCVDLAQRLALTEGEWAGNGKLERIAEEVRHDRAALVETMAALGEPVRRLEQWAGMAGARIGRLRPNGRVVAQSPLSRVMDLEQLRLGIEAKVAAWRALRARVTVDSRLDKGRLDELIAGGRSQITRLERLRSRAADELLGGALG